MRKIGNRYAWDKRPGYFSLNGKGAVADAQ